MTPITRIGERVRLGAVERALAIANFVFALIIVRMFESRLPVAASASEKRRSSAALQLRKSSRGHASRMIRDIRVIRGSKLLASLRDLQHSCLFVSIRG
jgi:hypothetical protein